MLLHGLKLLPCFYRVADSSLVSFFDFQIKGLDIIDYGVLQPFYFIFDPIDIIDSFLELAQHSHALLLDSNRHFLRRMVDILSIFDRFLKSISQVLLLCLDSIHELLHYFAVLVLNVDTTNVDTHLISVICQRSLYFVLEHVLMRFQLIKLLRLTTYLLKCEFKLLQSPFYNTEILILKNQFVQLVLLLLLNWINELLDYLSNSGFKGEPL